MKQYVQVVCSAFALSVEIAAILESNVCLQKRDLWSWRNAKNLGMCKEIRWKFYRNYAAWRKLWRIQNSAQNAGWPYLRQKDAIRCIVRTVGSTSAINATVRSLDMSISGVRVCFSLKRNWTDGKCKWIKGSDAKLLHMLMLQYMGRMVKLILALHVGNRLQRSETTTTSSVGHARSIFVPCAIRLSKSPHSITAPKDASNIRQIPEWGFPICASTPWCQGSFHVFCASTDKYLSDKYLSWDVLHSWIPLLLLFLLQACFEVSVVVVPTVTIVQFTFGNMNRNCSFIRSVPDELLRILGCWSWEYSRIKDAIEHKSKTDRTL